MAELLQNYTNLVVQLSNISILISKIVVRKSGLLKVVRDPTGAEESPLLERAANEPANNAKNKC